MRMNATRITSQFPLFLNLNHVFSIFLAILMKQYNDDIIPNQYSYPSSDTATQFIHTHVFDV